MKNQLVIIGNKMLFVDSRSQKSRGSSNGFGGPDRYMAVVVADADFNLSSPLDARNHKIHNIVKCGQYYGEHTTDRSRLYTQARDTADTVFESVLAELRN